MSNVQFDDQDAVRTYSTKPKGIEGLVISWGLVKDRKSAQMLLLVVAGVAVVVALFFMFSGGASNDVPRAEIDAAFENTL